MMFNEVVVQEEGKAILDELDFCARLFQPGYYVLDSVYLASGLVHKAMGAGL